MAGINSTVKIVDAMSPALKSINKALILVINSFEDMQSLSQEPMNVTNIEEARHELNQAAAAVRQLEENLNDAGKHTDDDVEKVDALTAALKKAAAVATTLGIARILGGVASRAIEYASDLTEVQNVVDVTFGNNSVVNDWAKTTLNAFGLNELSAKQYAGTMGAMLKSSGLAGDAVEVMSMKITELAGDMASFYNLDADEAFTKIRSGISGETEPLKQLGINMSVANLEAFALAEGIEKSYDSMSQAEQVILRYQYLLQAAADSQGDFARTSGSYANQVKLLQENWLQLTGKIANNSIPVLAQILQYLNNILSKIDEYAPALETVAISIGVVVLAIASYESGVLLAAHAQEIFNIALNNCPLLIVLTLITLLVAALAQWVQKVGSLEVAWMILCDSIQTKTQMLGVGVLEILQEMVNGAIDIINNFIEALNYIPGVSLDLVEHVTFADSELLAAEASHQARLENIDDKRIELGLNSAANGLTNGLDAFMGADATSKIMSDINGIASDTSSISDSLEITEEDLKYLRDIAEQESINRFTTAEIKIDMQNNNNISSDMDIDGIVSSLEDKLYESMMTAAEGV